MARMTNFRSAAVATGNLIDDSAFDTVKVVSDNIAIVTPVGASIIDVNTVAASIIDINSLATDITKLQSLYADKATLDSLYADKITLDSLYADKATLDSLKADKATLDSLYADKATLDSLYTDKTTLDRIYTSISNIDRVFTSIDNLDRIFSSIDSLDTIFTSILNVDTVASDITSVNVVATGIAKVNNYYDTFLGEGTTNPTTRRDGTALLGSELFVNTSTTPSRVQIYDITLAEWREIADTYTRAEIDAKDQTLDDVKVPRTSTTGSSVIPSGTTAERDANPKDGYIRFNTDLGGYEGYKLGNWLPLGGGATGSGTDDVFYENSQVVTESYTITAGKNAMSTGDITVGVAGVAITSIVGDGVTLSVNAVAHGLKNGDNVDITGTTSYNGNYTNVTVVDTDNYTASTIISAASEAVGTSTKEVIVTVSSGSTWVVL